MVLVPVDAAGGLSADDPPSLGCAPGKVPVVANLTEDIIRREGEKVKAFHTKTEWKPPDISKVSKNKVMRNHQWKCSAFSSPVHTSQTPAAQNNSNVFQKSSTPGIVPAAQSAAPS